jgi:trans-aconitate 2-methyltransferase
MTAWDAKAYHQVSNPQFEWGKRVLSRLVLRGDETVIDVGCGTGRLTELLAERLPRGRVIASDRDAGMVAEARAHLARFGDRVDFLVVNALELPALDADAVFSTATFHWIPEHDALFRALHRALRPSGVLVAQCGGGKNLARVLGRLDKILREPEIAPYFAIVSEPWFYATAEDTAERLRRAGFVDVETSLEPAPTPFADREQFKRFCDRVILGQRLGPLTDPVLRASVVERIVEAAAHDDPPFVLDYERLNMQARRPSE